MTVLALVMVSAPVVNAGDFDMHLDIAMAGGFGSVFVGRSLTNLQVCGLDFCFISLRVGW